MSSSANVVVSNTSVDVEIEFFSTTTTVYVGGFVGYISTSYSKL